MNTSESTTSESVSLGDAIASNAYNIHYVKNADVLEFDATSLKFKLMVSSKYQTLTLDDEVAMAQAKRVIEGLRKYYPHRELSLSKMNISTKCPFYKGKQCIARCGDICITSVIDADCLVDKTDVESNVSSKKFFPWTNGPTGLKRIVHGTLKPGSVSMLKEDIRDTGAINCTVKFTPTRVRYEAFDPDDEHWADDDEEEDVLDEVERKRKVDESMSLLDDLVKNKRKCKE